MYKIIEAIDISKKENFKFKNRKNSLQYLKNFPIILYGIGECSHWFHEIIMKKHNIFPIIALDNNASRGSWHNIKTSKLEEFDLEETVKDTAIVIVSVGSKKTFEEIKIKLEAYSFKNIMFLHEIYEIHNLFNKPDLNDNLWVKYFEDNFSLIDKAYRLLSDKKSKQVYESYLVTHITKIPQLISMSPRDEQYFPSDIDLRKGHDSYVSCGSYDGDTIRLLNQKCGKVNKICCFEPEPHIFKRLVDYLHTNKDILADQILAWPCAVYSHNQRENFICGDGLGSRIDKNGDYSVQCMNLDSSLINFKPTFISMDVENAEIDVLRGGEKLLKKTKPDLGICVYHEPKQIWEVPLFLESLNLGYKFYIRNYTSYTIETVLYAV